MNTRGVNTNTPKSYPFPGDPFGRNWIELAGANPSLVDQYRPSLVAFVAFDRNQRAHLVGTGFVIGGSPDFAMVVTAKHVLEGVAGIQRPERQANLKLGARDFRAIWMGSKTAAFLHVIHVAYNSSTDLAVCLVAPQEIDRASFAPNWIPLHPVLPRVGDQVQMVSADKMEIEELTPPSDPFGKDHHLSIFRRVSIRVGTVTGVYLDGHRQYRWPCFTTNIPAEPGMSGGFVCRPVGGAIVAASGVVSADSFSGQARADQMEGGCSVIACSWPAFALPIPREFGSPNGYVMRSLLDMVREGDMPEPPGGVAHLELISTADGTTQIGFRILS